MRINSKEYGHTESEFAREFDKLSEKNQKEILNLIKLKNEYKSK